ncbi:MAG: hypothetical protein WC641_03115 [Patescibacteria group bacterium]
MKNEFKRSLNQYGDLIKDASKSELSPDEEAKLNSVYAWLIENNAARSGSTKEAQQKVFGLQIEKQRIMLQLKERLKHLDESGFDKKGKYQIEIKSKGGKYFLADGSEVTRGQLLTDGEWGTDYHLDPATVPKSVRKRFYLEAAKRELMEVVDKQITEHEISKASTDEFKRGAYERRGSDYEMPGGICAEKMVSNFLRKLIYDQAADFKIMEGDAYQDVDQKLDFIIQARLRYRGVKAEEDAKAVGIQFTISSSPKKIKYKEHQVARAKGRLEAEDKIQDIVLVVLPLDDVRGMVDRWKNNQRPGGPDEMWRPEIKQRILEGLLGGILPKKELERLTATFMPGKKDLDAA